MIRSKLNILFGKNYFVIGPLNIVEYNGLLTVIRFPEKENKKVKICVRKLKIE